MALLSFTLATTIQRSFQTGIGTLALLSPFTVDSPLIRGRNCTGDSAPKRSWQSSATKTALLFTGGPAMSKRQRRAACLAYILRERSKRYWLVPLGFWGS